MKKIYYMGYYDSFDNKEQSRSFELRTICNDADAIDEMIYELLQAFIEVEAEHLDAQEEEDED